MSGTDAALAHGFVLANGNDVWIVGAAGTILRSDDQGKTFVRCVADPEETLVGVWASSADAVSIVGERHVHRIERRATLATLSLPVTPTCGTGLHGVWGTSARNVWVADGLLERTEDGGETWSSVPVSSLVGCVDDVRAAGDEVWASGSDFFVHESHDRGKTWARSPWAPATEESLRVRGQDVDDLWILPGHEGPVHSTDRGASWQPETVSEDPLTDLYSPGGGWAFAAGGGVWVRRGKPPWRREAAESAGVAAVFGTSPTDVWAVGANGLILHRP